MAELHDCEAGLTWDGRDPRADSRDSFLVNVKFHARLDKQGKQMSNEKRRSKVR